MFHLTCPARKFS